MSYKPYRTVFRDSNPKISAVNNVPAYPLTSSHITVPHGTRTFNYNASASNQTFTVPNNVTTIDVQLYGATGYTNNPGITPNGGNGGYVRGILLVIPGEVLNIHVGSYTGGGTGYGYYMANGGDYSAIYTSIGHRLVVAGGGGGNGGQTFTGGNGGGLIGQGTNSGGGGTQSAGGAGGTGNTANGSPGTGPALFSAGSWNQTGGNGANGSDTGGLGTGGGGGGYYGGGGGGAGTVGDAGAGGGGSSYVGQLSGTITNTQGGNAGTNVNGLVILTY